MAQMMVPTMTLAMIAVQAVEPMTALTMMLAMIVAVPDR
jgi:hypothetical protein